MMRHHPRTAPIPRELGEHDAVLQLRTFGTLDLSTSSGASAGLLLAQPRSIALLIYLLLARPGAYLSRDILCALFWPDADSGHARGALSQALSRIRRATGADVFEMRGRNELRVAPGAISCDVFAFEDAIGAGDHARALALYVGPFLDGFHASHMPGFERWAESERDRLRALAATAAAARAGECIAVGRLTDAEHAAERALSLTPDRESVVVELVEALTAAGDRVGALRLYDGWAAALARDLELEPSDPVQALARRIRASASLTASTTAAPEATDFGDPGVDRGSPPASTAAPRTSTPPTAAPPTFSTTTSGPAPRGQHGTDTVRKSGRWRLRHRLAFGTVAGLVLLLAGWAIAQVGFLSAKLPIQASGRAPAALSRGDWLVVADFEAPATDPALPLAFQTLLIRDLESAGYATVVGGVGSLTRRGLDDVLARMRLPPSTPIDPALACDIAEREGAVGALTGRALPLGNDYVLAATVLAVPGCTELIRASVVVPFEQLSQGVMAVSRELRFRLGESQASIRSSPALPPMTTSSMTSLRLVANYLSTPELWDDQVRGNAILLEAIRADSSFAFAHFLLALHQQRLGRFDRAMPHAVRAYELRSELPRQGRLGMEAFHLRYIESDPRAAMATVETIIVDYPAVADAAMPFLVDASIWVADWQRAIDVALAYLHRRPTGLGAHLARDRAVTAAWALGRVALADSLEQVRRQAERVAGRPSDPFPLLLHHLRHRDWNAAEVLCADHPAWDRCGYVYLARGRLTAARTAITSQLTAGAQPGQPWEGTTAIAALVQIALLHDQPDSAWTLVQRAEAAILDEAMPKPALHLNRFLLCTAASRLGRGTALSACAITERDTAEWDADPSFTLVLRSGAWSRRLLAVRSLERGDAPAALEQARAAVRSNFGNPGAVDHLIQASAFDALARPDSALAHYLDAVRIERDIGFPTAAAILLPLAPVYVRIGELAEEFGDIVTARQYYGAFLDLWAEADPVLQPQVRAVRDRVRRLPDPMER